MEYSKENVLGTSFADKKMISTKTKKAIILISILCVILIGIDMILIYGFAHTLQYML